MSLKVGFLGLGNMGEGMAANIAKAGFALAVRDLRREPIDRLVALGASEAGTNHALAQGADLVCVALFDEAQVLQAMGSEEGDAGLLAGLRPGSMVAIHSTVPPALTQTLAAQARAQGVEVIDAPMTGGGGAAAAAGKLTLFLGGEEAAIERARPVFSAMATHLFHMGRVGTGSATKILSNFMGVSNVLLVREALRVARAIGLDEDRWLEVINAGGVGSSWVSQNWLRIREQEDQYTTGKAGMVAMSSKDLNLARELARQARVSAPTLDHLVDHALPELDATGLTR